MRAAQVVELGGPTEVVEVQGDGPIEIVAVALKLDLAVAAGPLAGRDRGGVDRAGKWGKAVVCF